MRYLSHRLSAAMWSRVLLLWLILAIGAIVLGSIILGLGQFVQNNIRTELESQQISFSTVENLSAEESAIPGVAENAGQPLSTGNQAYVYSQLISLHLQQAAERAGYPGEVYATLGGIQGQLRAEIAAAEEANDQEALEAAQAELNTVTNLRNTILNGNNLRGNLLSAYGWDNFATGVLAGGAVVLIMALAFVVLFVYELRRGHLPPTEG